MSAFHRVDDCQQMDGAKFFRLAPLLVYYKGALQAQLELELQEEGPTDNLQYNGAKTSEDEAKAAEWAAKFTGRKALGAKKPVEGLSNEMQEHSDLFDVTMV